jgi:hypothetical protein
MAEVRTTCCWPTHHGPRASAPACRAAVARARDRGRSIRSRRPASSHCGADARRESASTWSSTSACIASVRRTVDAGRGARTPRHRIRWTRRIDGIAFLSGHIREQMQETRTHALETLDTTLARALERFPRGRLPPRVVSRRIDADALAHATSAGRDGDPARHLRVHDRQTVATGACELGRLRAHDPRDRRLDPFRARR